MNSRVIKLSVSIRLLFLLLILLFCMQKTGNIDFASKPCITQTCCKETKGVKLNFKFQRRENIQN